ncbi:MAG: sulfatase [Phycisphaerales bacterium]|nr:sulfatase [Phycisphaerales bacterium]
MLHLAIVPLLALLADTPQTRPNIIFFLSDDHACNAVGAYGSVINETPHIDRLAKEGATFDRAFCSNGICAPSRAAFLTGVHGYINGVENNSHKFDGTQPTIATQLNDAGYTTAMIGKWHLKTDPVGFDYWDILPGQGHYYAPDFRTKDGKRRVQGHVSEITADLALDWLKNKRDPQKPFMLMMNQKAPHRAWMPAPEHLDMFEGELIPEPPSLLDDHEGRGTAAKEQEMEIADHMWLWYDLKIDPDEGTPLTGPDRWAKGRYDRMSDAQAQAWKEAYDPRNEAFDEADLEGDDLTRYKYQRYIKDYLRCVAGVDDSVGRVLDWLDENDLTDNTIVIYASDQGFFLGEQGWYDKRFMNDPALRLPLIVRWPGVTKPGSRIDAMTQNIDLMPTLCAAGGAAVPERVQGEDLRPLLEGETPEDWRDAIYYRYIEQGVHNVAPHEGVRTDRYALIHWPTHGEWELFDLETDPQEVRNVHDDPAFADVRSRMHDALDKVRTIYAAPSMSGS